MWFMFSLSAFQDISIKIENPNLSLENHHQTFSNGHTNSAKIYWRYWLAGTFEVLWFLVAICDIIMRSLNQDVPAKPTIGTMCLQDNLADCVDTGGL